MPDMTKPLLRTIYLSLFILIASSCANYKLHNAEPDKNVAGNNISHSSPISHSIFLIGDVGEGSPEAAAPTLKLLQKHLDDASKNSSVIFLGNNIQKGGMPSKSDKKKRAAAEDFLNQQLSVLENYKGQPIFLPGNQDWKKYGQKGVKRQEKYIESMLNKGIEDEDDWNNYFLPNQGCPGPDVIEINEQLVIIVIDSQWWLKDWEEQPNINAGCDVKSREAFALELEATIKDHKNKNIVFAAHHSFRSVGPHGGKFSAKNHLFPMTTDVEKGYMPLPGVGSLFLFLRSAGILPQDEANTHYKTLKQAALKPARDNGEFIFVSGHDNSLQYLKSRGQHFVVSGSGAKRTATSKKNAIFSYGQKGFSKIDFYQDGSSFLSFFVSNEDGTEGTEVFRTKIKGPLPKVNPDDLPQSFPVYESKKDSLLTFPSTRKIKPLGPFATYMLGKRRRDVYLVKNNFATLDLSTFKGGCTVIKKGGGKQTNSLRLAGADGKEYVMRSLTKDPSRGVPYPFNQLAVVNFLFNETFLGTHCYAPPTLGPISDAANVYHTNPNLYFIPKQPALGAYNDYFGDEVYVVEERASKSWPEADFFGNAKKFVNTPKLLSKLEKSRKHHVDQKWVARSRLFDVLIGDIDRHGDQWRWAVSKDENDEKVYRPIPRDRDNAYCTYDGFAYKLLKPYHYIVKMLGIYENEVPNPAHTYYNARHFDHTFLNELTLEDWQKEAAYIQEQVTDEVIKEAMTMFPKHIYEMTGTKIEKVLMSRRDNVQQIAKRMYLYLAKKSMVRGTDKREYFEVIRTDDEHTTVSMYDSNKKGEKKELLYQRVFKTSETKEIYLYGLGGDDVFKIKGEVNAGLKVFVVGGPGNDEFDDTSVVKGLGKKDRFYDTKEGNKTQFGVEAKNKQTNIARKNIYEYLGNHFDASTFVPFPSIGFNASDGFKIGFSGKVILNRFNKAPHGAIHNLGINYAFGTKGIDLAYNAVFFETTEHWDFVLNSEFRNNRYAFNYFGIGNNSSQELGDLPFYQVQQSMAQLDFGWQRRFNNEIGNVSIRPLVQWSEFRDTEARFINSDDNGLSPEDLESRWYAGAMIDLNFSNTDNPISPRDGFSFKNTARWQTNLTGSERNFTTFGSSFTLYKSFLKKRNLVFASRLGTDLIRGNYDFFYAPALGQDENIRGYYGQRYRGETTFFHTSDLRLALGSFKNSILPFSFGITGSYDYGRIFDDADSSDAWHSSYGGALWIAPLNVSIISFSYNQSADGEGARFMVGVGHAF